MTAPDPRLEEIEFRLSKATPGPWWLDRDGDVCRPGLSAVDFIDTGGIRPDAEFIAAAPTDVAYLLAELRKAQDKLARVEEQCAAADDMAAYVMGEDVQAALRMCARGIRAAVADATGGERGYE